MKAANIELAGAGANSSVSDLNGIMDVVTGLHSDVEYGKGGQMIDQVKNCAKIAQQSTGNKRLEVVALLHKSQERKRIGKDKEILTDDDIRRLVTETIDQAASAEVIDALQYLKTEPEDKAILLNWARKSPPLAQGMLLIEKIVNFEASEEVLKELQRDPQAKVSKPPEWHLKYYEERIEVVEAVKSEELFPLLYQRARQSFERGTELAKSLIEKRQDPSSSPAAAEGLPLANQDEQYVAP
jgi:hypothetical protein